MALNAKHVPRTGGNRVEQQPLEPGPYPARLVQVLDLGVQPQMPYQGQDKPPAHMMMVTYELLDAFMVDEDGNEQEDKPRWVSEEFALRNIEVDLANSTKRYKAIDPNLEHDGDWTRLIGSPCTVTIGHKKGAGKNAGRIFDKVLNVAGMRPKDAANAPELKGKAKVLELDAPDMEVFNSLPEWIQTKIKGNLNYNGSALMRALAGEKPEVKKAGKDEPKNEEENW